MRKFKAVSITVVSVVVAITSIVVFLATRPSPLNISPAPPATAPFASPELEVDPSQFLTTVEIPTSELKKVVEDAVPRSLSMSRQEVDCRVEECHLAWIAKRSGISVTPGPNNMLRLTAGIRAKARVEAHEYIKYKHPCFKDVVKLYTCWGWTTLWKIKETVRPKGTLTVDVAFRIQPDGNLKVTVRPDIHISEASVGPGGIISVRGKVTEAIRPELLAAASDIERQIAKEVDLRTKLEGFWAELGSAQALHTDDTIGMTSWLRVQPEELIVQNMIFRDGRLVLALGAKARLTTVVGKKPEPTKPGAMPSVRVIKNANSHFNMALPTGITYDDLTQAMGGHLNGNEFEFAQTQFTVHDVEVFSNGEQLVFGVDFEADRDGDLLDAEGKLYFVGRPAYDVETGMLTVEDFDFDINTENTLVDVAAWLMHESLKESLQEHLIYDLDNSIGAARQTLNQRMKNMPLNPHVALSGSLKQLRVKELDVAEWGVQVVFEGSGELRTHVTSIPQFET
jgi:hypothetical protein